MQPTQAKFGSHYDLRFYSIGEAKQVMNQLDKSLAKQTGDDMPGYYGSMFVNAASAYPESSVTMDLFVKDKHDPVVDTVLDMMSDKLHVKSRQEENRKGSAIDSNDLLEDLIRMSTRMHSSVQDHFPFMGEIGNKTSGQK